MTLRSFIGMRARPVTITGLMSWAHRCYSASFQAGWWTDINTGEKKMRNHGQLLMLVVTELSEAAEGHRKSLSGTIKMDDKLPNRPMEEVEMADVMIRCFDFSGGYEYQLTVVPPQTFLPTDDRLEAQLKIAKNVFNVYDHHCRADITFAQLWMSRVLADVQEYSKVFELDLFGAMEEKIAYNAKRPDHKMEARQAPGGKAL